MKEITKKSMSFSKNRIFYSTVVIAVILIITFTAMDNSSIYEGASGDASVEILSPDNEQYIHSDTYKVIANVRDGNGDPYFTDQINLTIYGYNPSTSIYDVEVYSHALSQEGGSSQFSITLIIKNFDAGRYKLNVKPLDSSIYDEVYANFRPYFQVNVEASDIIYDSDGVTSETLIDANLTVIYDTDIQYLDLMLVFPEEFEDAINFFISRIVGEAVDGIYPTFRYEPTINDLTIMFSFKEYAEEDIIFFEIESPQIDDTDEPSAELQDNQFFIKTLYFSITTDHDYTNVTLSHTPTTMFNSNYEFVLYQQVGIEWLVVDQDVVNFRIETDSVIGSDIEVTFKLHIERLEKGQILRFRIIATEYGEKSNIGTALLLGVGTGMIGFTIGIMIGFFKTKDSSQIGSEDIKNRNKVYWKWGGILFAIFYIAGAIIFYFYYQ